MQKQTAAFPALVIIFLVSVSSLAAIKPAPNTSDTFYVGVTYCGHSVIEAKQLVDQVKNYTNLFVLQSGYLMTYSDIIEVGDYAVNAGLKYIFYFGDSTGPATTANVLVENAEERWNSSFLGVYYKDEPGGKILDEKGLSIGSVYRNPDGSVGVFKMTNESDQTFIMFLKSGEIQVTETLTFDQSNATEKIDNELITSSKSTVYQPNGTITYTVQNTYRTNVTSENQLNNGPFSTHLPWNGTAEPYPYQTITIGPFTYQSNGIVQDQNGNSITDQGNISQFEPYQQLLASNPLETPAKTAESIVSFQQAILSEVRNHSDATVFTSDYALYWFDYKFSYSTVFAQFVGNESRERHIALCRGAAETFGRDWGVIITWKYNQAPYLESGDELYNDLALAYTSGAKYGIVFSYPNITAYGTLTDEHFEALQKFWNTLHSDPKSLSKTQTRVAYIVPADYGFGFRSAADTIWGQFPADDQSAKIYNDVIALTTRYGASLNILYDGPETKANLVSYSVVYYYNQTIAQ